MTANAFGGEWTAEKLEVLRKYLHFYTTALASRFKLAYIDTFAGTGRCRITTTAGRQVEIDGSARLALDCEGFDEYYFIEHKAAHADELQALMSAHPRGKLARLARGRASDLLWPMLMAKDWREWRGVLFLDPYGLQVNWPMVQQIARTRALDVFFLVSLSGLYRNAALDLAAAQRNSGSALTRFLGTDDWPRLYVRKQGDLFGGDTITRDPGYQDMLDFTTERLRSAFPHVADPCLMGRRNGAPLFALYFAVSNPDKRALQLASRVGDDILAPLRL